MSVAYPMLFELSNSAVGKHTHCGVLEFTADEGRCYLPFWMMQGLFIEEGALLNVKNVTLPKAKFVKFQAQHVDFIKITNPRAVLEVTLRKFTCLTKGDVICLPYANKKYYLEVTEVKPNDAVSIVEADFSVDFDEPVGYQDSEFGKAERAAKEQKIAEELAKAKAEAVPRALQKATTEVKVEEPKFIAFSGSGQRIDGRNKTSSTSTPSPSIESKNIPPVPNNIASSGGLTLNSKINSTSKLNNSNTYNTITPPPIAPLPYQPTIASKYAKTKPSVTAFTGTGYKLSS